MRTHFAYQDEISEGPHLQEAELQNIYRDLLSFSEVDTNAIREPSNTEIKSHQVQDLIRTLEERLPTFETAVDANTAQTGLSSKLLARMRTFPSSAGHETSNFSLSQHVLLLDNGSPIRKMINRLRSVISKMDATWGIGVALPTSGTNHIPFGMLSNAEWDAISQVCVSKSIFSDDLSSSLA